MRLIDADAMHTFVEEKVAERKDGRANGVPYEWAYALTFVDMQPTIDAEPVRHGRWEHYKTMHNIVCSVCKSHRPYKKTERGYHVVWNANYCPNCGAKMEENAN